jgi:hypothetical protein
LQDRNYQIGEADNKWSGIENLYPGFDHRLLEIRTDSQVEDQIKKRRQRKTNLFLDIPHMNSLTTMLFPDTNVFRDSLYPVLLLCSPLHYLQPVEPLAEQRETDTDLFMEKGLCQAHTPALLEEAERQRFLHLIHDLKNRKDDYAAQLSTLTVAELSAPGAGLAGDTRSQIISTLIGQDSGTADREKTAELWKARLILAIGEVLDQEQEELMASMNLLDASELEMLAELQGDDSAEADELLTKIQQVRTDLAKPRQREVKMRFWAWLKLTQCEPAPEVQMWLASSRDAADEVFNLLESRDEQPLPVLKLAIPGEIGVSPAHLVDQVLHFQSAASPLCEAVSADLQELCNAELVSPAPAELLLPGRDDYVDKWDGLVEELFPRNSHGRAWLTFYLLPHCQVPELLTLQHSAADALHGILAVLHRESSI